MLVIIRVEVVDVVVMLREVLVVVVRAVTVVEKDDVVETLCWYGGLS